MKEKFPGVFVSGSGIFTKNLVPGSRVYGEDLVKISGIEYRRWDYTRSKPAAAIQNGLNNFPLSSGMKVLYLGVASGTTASHFSDIIGRDGIIYGVDVADRVLRDLVSVAEKRGNIVPIMGDARRPEDYSSMVMEKVDLIFEDVADPDQMKILLRNAEAFLNSGGHAMVSIKSQSIDVIRKPKDVYKEFLDGVSEKFDLVEKVELDPYEKHHLYVVLKSKV